MRPSKPFSPHALLATLLALVTLFASSSFAPAFAGPPEVAPVTPHAVVAGSVPAVAHEATPSHAALAPTTMTTTANRPAETAAPPSRLRIAVDVGMEHATRLTQNVIDHAIVLHEQAMINLAHAGYSLKLSANDLLPLLGIHRPFILTSPEQRRLADGMVVAEGHATQADADVFEKHLAQLPPRTLEFLREVRIPPANEGVKLRAGARSVVDVMPELRGVHPRGWPEGSTWEQVNGVYSPVRQTVAVAMTRWHTINEGGSFDTVLHEAMHGVDHAAGYPSMSADFLEAYAADRPSLSSYLQQEGTAGPSEAFAEIGARFFGDDRSVQRAHPNLYRYFKAHADGVFVSASPSAPTALVVRIRWVS